MATTPKSLKPDLGSLRISDTKRNAAKSGRRWLWLILGVVALILLAVGASAFRDRKPEVEVAAVRKPVNGPAGVLNASAPRISHSHLRLRRVALRFVSLMRREPRSGFSDFGVVAMRRHLLKLDAALKSKYAPGSPFISARESGNWFAYILPGEGRFGEGNECPAVRSGCRDKRTRRGRL